MRNTGHVLWEDCQSQAALSSYTVPALNECRILGMLLKLSDFFFLSVAKREYSPPCCVIVRLTAIIHAKGVS